MLALPLAIDTAMGGSLVLTGHSLGAALAVDLAVRLGMFLAGFARGEDFTVYAGIEALM